MDITLGNTWNKVGHSRSSVINTSFFDSCLFHKFVFPLTDALFIGKFIGFLSFCSKRSSDSQMFIYDVAGFSFLLHL